MSTIFISSSRWAIKFLIRSVSWASFRFASMKNLEFLDASAMIRLISVWSSAKPAFPLDGPAMALTSDSGACMTGELDHATASSETSSIESIDSSMSYSVPPPAYTPAPPTKKYDPAGQPLLSGEASSNPNAYYQQANAVDDFEYGVNVWDSSVQIRHAFIMKVYTILFVQILGTCIVAGTLSQSPNVILWVQANQWAFYVPLFGTLVNLGFLFWKRHSSPLNFVLLGLFTLLESFTLGIAISFYDQTVVLQALLITLGVFLGLTLFTLQSKYDFSGMGPFLFAGLLVLIMTGFVSMVFPFSSTTELVYAVCGCLLFSGYVVYDTFTITKRLSADEYIMGSISLYLDFINLFLSILRVLNNVNRD